MSTANKSSAYRTRMLTTTAMLGALSGLLMLIEFPLGFIAPSFYKLDLSEIPVMIGTFAFGPIQGVVIEAVKIIIKLILKGTSTGFVGDLANFIIGCAMVIPAGIIYKRKKTKKSAVIGMIVSTLVMAVVGVFLNAYVMIPMYSAFMPIEQIVEAGKSIIPWVSNTFTFCLFCVLPFNLIKGIIVSVVVAIIYKPLSRLIHKGI
ncbi:MAG: ECF transporter S component [Ruminococcus sp.]|nr:ECF transporter S component [Ruminococcus sp.]